MKASLFPYTLNFTRPFQLSHGTRLGTQALFLFLEHNGIKGFSEATFPPYLDEKMDVSIKQIEKINFEPILLPTKNINELSTFVDTQGLSAFTRSLVINCISDLNSKLLKKSFNETLGITTKDSFYKSCITVTKNDIDNLGFMNEKLEIMKSFSHLKLKLDGNNDIGFIERIISKTNMPFCVDVNQGWENESIKVIIGYAINLKNFGCELIEQPFHKSNFKKHSLLKQEGILGIYADESIQNLEDFEKYGENFNGINIKLLKCGGIDKALALAKRAKELDKKIIIGCMSESSCGCATAFSLSAFADYLDIDGPWLINNNPFSGFSIKDSKFSIDSPIGIGVEPLNSLFLH